MPVVVFGELSLLITLDMVLGQCIAPKTICLTRRLQNSVFCTLVFSGAANQRCEAQLISHTSKRTSRESPFPCLVIFTPVSAEFLWLLRSHSAQRRIALKHGLFCSVISYRMKLCELREYK